MLLIIVSSIEYPYEYIDDESIEEKESILDFNLMGLIVGFIKKRIYSLKSQNFWIEKFGNKLWNQLQKWSDKKASSAINAIRDCDERLNKENKDQVIVIRKEVGLPLDISDFCQNNPDCRTKIKNDYDYFDVMIFKIPLLVQIEMIMEFILLLLLLLLVPQCIHYLFFLWKKFTDS